MIKKRHEKRSFYVQILVEFVNLLLKKPKS